MPRIKLTNRGEFQSSSGSFQGRSRKLGCPVRATSWNEEGIGGPTVPRGDHRLSARRLLGSRKTPLFQSDLSGSRTRERKVSHVKSRVLLMAGVVSLLTLLVALTVAT